ncbi:MAG: sulfotransferase [Gammaproteobacteria bacterium]
MNTTSQAKPGGPVAAAERILAEAIELHRAGKFVEAERIYRRILQHEPANPDALHLLGLVAKHAGKSEAAIRLLRQAIANNPEMPTYRANLALMYEDQGQFAEAQGEAEAALRLDPANGSALFCLANVLRAQDHYAEAAERYRQATRLIPDDPALWSNLGATLQTLGLDDEAVESLAKAVEISPAEAELHSNLGNAMVACGRVEEGLQEFRESLRLDPGFAPAHTNLASALMQSGRSGEAAVALRDCLEIHPGHRQALAFLASAAHEDGDDEARNILMDYQGLMAERQCACPPGYDDLDAFNRALVKQVINHPTLLWEPVSKSTRKGSQTGELAGSDGPLAALEAMVRDAMSTYLASIESCSEHPYLSTAPEQWKLTMWATVLDQGGHQAAHVHPTGWLSGVYYAAVPEAGPESPADAGWIEFGQAPDEFHLQRPASVRRLEPVPGLMLLFPSYFYHRTLPFTGAGKRVSIAFDLMPVQERKGRETTAGGLGPTELTAELERTAQMLREMRVNEAAKLARRLVSAAPEHAHAAYLLGLAVYRQGKSKEAADWLQKAVDLAPGTARYHMDLGACHSQLGDFEAAVGQLQTAISLDPEDLEAYMRLATLFSDHGDFEQAANVYAQALDQDPGSGAALYGLASIRHLEADDPRVLRQMEILEHQSMQPRNEAVTCFAVARTLDQAGQVDQAMPYYHRGNRRKHELADFSIEAERANTRRIIDSFSAEVFEQFANLGDSSELPVFIIGMPRSGTTLVEQILDSHPSIHGGGELNDLWRILGGIGRWLPEGRNLPEAVADVDPAAWAELGQRLAHRLRHYDEDALRITDKLPFNYTLTGIIRLMLPRARIIHCVRDPRDTCISCYTTSFQSDRGFTCDLAELGETYRLYWQLMRHWRSVLPGGLFEIRYEDLVRDVEHEARRMIDYVGLEWSEECLNFHLNQRKVITASMTQVRQPAYQSSVGRWQRYADHIQPLLHSLGDLRAYDVLDAEDMKTSER